MNIDLISLCSLTDIQSETTAGTTTTEAIPDLLPNTDQRATKTVALPTEPVQAHNTSLAIDITASTTLVGEQKSDVGSIVPGVGETMVETAVEGAPRGERANDDVISNGSEESKAVVAMPGMLCCLCELICDYNR